MANLRYPAQNGWGVNFLIQSRKQVITKHVLGELLLAPWLPI